MCSIENLTIKFHVDLDFDKLAKLKERIRRQREHLEEAAGKSKEAVGSLDRPLAAAGGGRSYGQSGSAAPSAHVRKVIAAPPAPGYKGTHALCLWMRGQLLKHGS